MDPLSPPGCRRGGDRRKLRASLAASIAEGATAEVFGACAGGAVLTGWALYLGASPVTIGLLGALPLAAQIVQVPAAWLTQTLGAKHLAVATIGAARLVWLPLVALPFLRFRASTALAVFVTVVGVAAVCGVVGNNAWTTWMGELIPSAVRGRFFGRRMVYLNISGTLASLGAGVALDALARRGLTGDALAALAAIACVAGVVSIWLLGGQQDPGPAREPIAGHWRDVADAVRDRSTQPVLRYLFAWNAAVGLSASFFSFHMLSNLRMGFTLAATYGIVVALVRVASVRTWGRLVDRFGARPVLVVCSFGISVVPVIWLFATPDRLWPIAVEAIVAGSLWGGHGIAMFDLSIALSPRRSRPFYLAAFATAGGVGFAAASTLAGLLAHALRTPLYFLGAAWLDLHVLFALSALARAAAAGLALRIDEPAARGVRELGRELAAMLSRRSSRLPWPRPAGI